MDAQHQGHLKNIELEKLKETIQALSPELYAQIESDKAWSQAFEKTKIKLPEVVIGGSSGDGSGADAFQAGTMNYALVDLLRNMYQQRETKKINPQQKIEVLDSADDD
ncbi:MAG: hypothetical protein GDA43_14910 [Hormoscilla sp. SP5CHS1]|nr:hypothetical protein [Hormoscilla sp. SP12CHS1]MBC6454326.1 hypothetical protein [Hormoscilla sp. SP5CHS1]